jgi:hypothetical protein
MDICTSSLPKKKKKSADRINHPEETSYQRLWKEVTELHYFLASKHI